MPDSGYYSLYDGAQVDSAVGIALNLGSNGTIVSSGGSVIITAESGAYVNGGRLATEEYVDSAVSGGVIDSGAVLELISSTALTSGSEIFTSVGYYQLQLDSHSATIGGEGAYARFSSGTINLSGPGGATINGEDIATSQGVNAYVDSRISALSRADIIDWRSTSAHISVLSGGAYYTFARPISALDIDTIPRSLEDTNILCNFSGGSSFNTPDDVGIVGDIEISSGFYHIGVLDRQVVVYPVTYSGSTGYTFYMGGTTEETVSGWVISSPSMAVGDVVTVYMGGVALDLAVNQGRVDVHNGGLVSTIDLGQVYSELNTDGGTLYDVTIGSGVIVNGFETTAPHTASKITNGSAEIADNVYACPNNLIVSSGGSVFGMTISSGQSLSLAAMGAKLTNFAIHSGAHVDYVVEDDITGHDYTIIEGSNTNIAADTLHYSGAAFTGECASGSFTNLAGTYRIGVGSGISALTPMVGNPDTDKTRIYAFSGAYISGASIGMWGDVDLYPGASGADIVLGGYAGARSQCELTVWGGTASNVTVSSNGYVNCLSGGQVLGTTTIESGGSARGFRYGRYENLHLNSGGSCEASGAAHFDSLTVSGGVARLNSVTAGAVNVFSGGGCSARGVTLVDSLGIKSGANASIFSGTTVTTLNVSGGSCIASRAVLGAVVLSGVTSSYRPTLSATSCTINSLTISKQGILQAKPANSIGYLEQFNGYTIASANTIKSAVVHGSDFYLSSGCTVDELTAVVGPDVSIRKTIKIFSNAVVSNLLVSDTASGSYGFTLSNYGVVSITSGGRLYNTEFSNIVVGGGALVDGINPKPVWANYEEGKVYVGTLTVMSGGTALNVVSNGEWVVSVYEGGSISYVE